MVFSLYAVHTGTESDSGSSTVVVQSGSTRAQSHKSVKVIAKWKEGIDGAESPNNKVQVHVFAGGVVHVPCSSAVYKITLINC